MDQYIHTNQPQPHIIREPHAGAIDGSFPSSTNAESSRVEGGRKLKDLRPQPMARHFGIETLRRCKHEQRRRRLDFGR